MYKVHKNTLNDTKRSINTGSENQAREAKYYNMDQD